MIGDEISRIAQTYLGKKEIMRNGVYGNYGFEDPIFQQELIDAGWEEKDSWCAFLMIVIWRKAYAPYPKTLAWFNRLCSGNSQQMGRNFHADPTWETSTTTPVIGAAVIFGDVGSDISGHTASGIVSINGQYYSDVEGNTIPPGNPGNVANGYTVASHTHLTGAPHPVSGLQFIRFVYPMEPID